MEHSLDIKSELVSAVMGTLGKKGGRSKSPKKLAAMRRNIKKAWAARRKKKRLIPAGQ